MAGSHTTLKGQGYYPGSSRQFEAYLQLDEASGRWSFWNADDATMVLSCTQDQITLDNTAGSGPRHVHLPDNWLFLTTDPKLSMLAHEPVMSRLLRRMEQFHPRLITFVIATLGATWLVWKYGIGILVAIAVFLTPDVVRTSMNAGSLKSIDLFMAEPSTLETTQQDQQRRIFAKLAAQLPPSDQEHLALEFREMPGLGPNALALPGGTIVLTDALVTAYGDDEDLIAGIIGHEMGHVIEDHSLKQLYRSLSVYVLIALIAGDVGPILEDLTLEGQLLLQLSFSREHERDADAFGVNLVSQAGYDPHGLARFFEEISEHDPDNSWFSTHPNSTERQDAIERHIREHMDR